MAHLTPAQLVDLAEGTESERGVPHLAHCDACRGALAELRATMADVARNDVLEPSPLFWDHLSARVREAVANEKPGRSSWIGRWLRPRFIAPVLAGALALVVIVTLAGRTAKAPALSPIPSSVLPAWLSGVISSRMSSQLIPVP